MKYRTSLVVFICLYLLILSSHILAHGESPGFAGSANRADWVDRIPIVIACIIIVIAVDAVFVVPILRKLREGHRAGDQTVASGD